MPEYDYHCAHCENEFAIECSMAEHERKEREKEIHCPKCGSADVKHVIQSVFVTTARKS